MTHFDLSLVWFRRDLRSFDQAALHEALSLSRRVHCVFIFDRDILAPLQRDGAPADRRVAFIPATADRSAALEIRHPALVRYLVQVYEVLWTQATPLTRQLPTTAPGVQVTAVQQSIARLLSQGHVDDAVARKLGISVRTCRAHIAKLMQALGADSRTHLGALIVRSGIVDEATAPGTRKGPASES